VRRMVLLIGLLALIVVGVLPGCSGASFANSKITPGVFVGNINLGGLTREQAQEQLAVMVGKLSDWPVVIQYGEDAWTLEAGALGIALDSDRTLEKAAAVGHNGSFISQWRERSRVKKEGEHIHPELSTDWVMLKQKVAAEMGQIIAEPVNAGFQVTPEDKVVIVPAQTGTSIDFNALAKAIAGVVTEAADQDEAASGVEIAAVELPVVTVKPQRSTADIEAMQINGRIAQYTTRFDTGQEGRTYNIAVAAAALDGVLLAPGEDLSFNRVVGPRSTEAGYKSANVIINNELVPGLGGGVCQVSSTLYNAVLLANLQITERSNHTLPVSYVPLGQDATVVYGATDFRFTNNKENYLYIKSLVAGDTITFKIFGNRDTTPPVEVASWVTETIPQQTIYEDDPNLAAGEQVIKQKGNDGFKTATARYIWENGVRKTEQLAPSYYHPVKRIVAVGVGQVKPSVVVPPEDAVIPVSPGTIDQPAIPLPEPEVPNEPGSEPGASGEGQPTGEEIPLLDLDSAV